MGTLDLGNRLNAARNYIGENGRTLILGLMRTDLRKRRRTFKRMKIKPGQRLGDFEAFQEKAIERLQLLERMIILLGGDPEEL